VTYFRNIGTPSISREPLELETPNFAHRFITRVIGSKRASKGSRDLILEFKAPLYISRTVRARNVEFGMQIHH